MDPLGKRARMTEGAVSEWWGSLRCRLDFCLLFESGERAVSRSSYQLQACFAPKEGLDFLPLPTPVF